MQRTHSPSPAPTQHGLTLLELLIGSALASLVIAAALNTLAMSKAATLTTSEASLLQQDASFALRTMARLIRQAGALEPLQTRSSLGLPTLSLPVRTLARVEAQPGLAGASDRVVVGVQTGQRAGANADCFGNTIAAAEFSTVFAVNAEQQLTCQTRALGSAGAPAQPLIGNVRHLALQYRIAWRDAAGREWLQMSRSAPAAPQSSSDPRVVAIELCLELEAPARIQGVDTEWLNCQGEPVRTQQRLRRVFRQLVAVRAD